jgi:hypothetical protein
MQIFCSTFPEVLFTVMENKKMYLLVNMWGDMRERDHWGDPGVDGSIIL